MKTLHDLLRDRIHARIEHADWVLQQANPDTRKQVVTLQQLERQWCPQFESWMRARLRMGGLRYGLLGAKNKPCYDHIPSIKRRCDAYVATGNVEHLVDIANLALVEWLEGQHPTKHFAASDNTSEHCRLVDG